MSVTPQSVQRVLETIPDLYRGPGGAVAVLKDGELIGQHVWGYADVDQRIAMKSDTLVPICSITKQLVAAAMLDLERNPPPEIAAHGDVRTQLTDKIREMLRPELHDSGMTVDYLCDMQSGFRDYWALCTPLGSKPDTPFSIADDSRPILDRIKTLHFQPGMQFSYSNTNWHILGRAIEAISKQSLPDLVAERVFAPAGMKTASLVPDTAQQPGPCVGYEGDDQHGFVPATNRIEWSGDAGAIASLEDMISYERHFDQSWSSPQSWYRAAATPKAFGDGRPARYRYGLKHVELHGVATVGHGGALRGYRLHRRYVPSERLSAIVLFNHEASAEEAAAHILTKVLNLSSPEPQAVSPAQEWFGVFLDRESQMAVTVSPGSSGKLLIAYPRHPESVALVGPKEARSRDLAATIDGDCLRIDRIEDNLKIDAQRLAPLDPALDGSFLAGDYHCKELDSVLHCSGHGRMLYATFDGHFGQGPAHLMRPLGGDVWAMADPRGMDAPAPGDWTVVLHRNEHGGIVGLTIGCWLARGLEFVRI